MNKYLVCIDTETTGLSKQTDRILQLSAMKFDRNFKALDRFDVYIKPSGAYVISEGASDVHGITQEFIEKNGKALKDVAPEFLEFIKDCDYVGYNSNSFDIQFIYQDLLREGFELPIEGREFYDVMLMEKRINPRNLGAVFQRYTGKTMEDMGLDAHNSMSDVIATVKVLQEQFRTHNLNWDEVCEWEENKMLTPEGSVRSAGDNDQLILFAFGKYKEQDIYEVMKSDPSYCRWWSENVATPYTRKIVRNYCAKRIQESKEKK